MNPRIRELAEQAKKYALDAMIKITDREQALKVYSETYNTKFAELIVKECIEQIQLSTARDPQYTPQYKQSVGHIHRSRQHFGVE
jgi:hypothetical protein